MGFRKVSTVGCRPRLSGNPVKGGIRGGSKEKADEHGAPRRAGRARSHGHSAAKQSLYADTVVYGPNAYFTKVALLLVIARVFHTFTRTRMVAHALMGVMAGYYVPALLIKINVCRPIAAFWAPPSLSRLDDGGGSSGNSTGGGGTATAASAAVCINQSDLFVADTVLSAITDFAVLALPIPATMSLRLPFRRRLRVWAMLGLGGVATLASIVRMVVVVRLRNVTDETVEFVRFNLLGYVGLGPFSLLSPFLFFSLLGFHSSPSLIPTLSTLSPPLSTRKIVR